MNRLAKLLTRGSIGSVSSFSAKVTSHHPIKRGQKGTFSPFRPPNNGHEVVACRTDGMHQSTLRLKAFLMN